MKRFANTMLVIGSIVATAVAAEGATPLIDGLPLFTDYLPNTVDRDVTSEHMDSIPRASGISRSWFFSDPPPLPNRRPVPAEWVKLATEIGQVPNWVANSFRPAEAFKAWNSEFAKAPCEHSLLRHAPGFLYTYPSLDGTTVPRFRFLPNATTPLGLVTNELGWRGPPVQFAKADKVVRIVFVGASTTVNSHYYPYSYPELIGHWLNQWAAARKLDVRFEALNAGREGMTSTDIEAIVRQEVMTLQRDLVVYYEGANQVDLSTLLKTKPAGAPVRPNQAAEESGFSRWLRDASHRSAIVRRFQAALGMVGNPGTGEEWPKPDYEIAWPAGLDDKAPDWRRPDLPVNLSTIVRDIERTRVELRTIGADFALSSYAWLAKEGMVVDPVRNKALLDHLNYSLFPFRYRDIERLANFQNKVLETYAAANGLPFFDVAGQIPRAPDLFTDGVHQSYGGIRLHAWIVMQGIVPLAEKKLAAGAWPRAATAAEPPPGLFFTPRQIAVSCKPVQ